MPVVKSARAPMAEQARLCWLKRKIIVAASPRQAPAYTLQSGCSAEDQPGRVILAIQRHPHHPEFVWQAVPGKTLRWSY